MLNDSTREYALKIFYLCLQNGKRLETVVKELGELKKSVHQITAEKVRTTVITLVCCTVCTGHLLVIFTCLIGQNINPKSKNLPPTYHH